MDIQTYNYFIKKIKVFKAKVLTIAPPGDQSRHNLYNHVDKDEKFTLIVNRKGHRNLHNLTILLNKVTKNEILVRFDVNGSDHQNPDGTIIPTPHLHLYNDEYDNGGIAIPLSEVSDTSLIKELDDSLEFFMNYTNIKKENVKITTKLLK